MNHLLTEMAKVCEKYPVEEKRLVVPSYQTGHVLCETLSQAGVGWVNLRTETPTGLALQIAGDYLTERHITLLDGCLTSYVVIEILQRLQERGELHFFNKQKATRGLAAALTASLLELRESNVTGSSLVPDTFVSSGGALSLSFRNMVYWRSTALILWSASLGRTACNFLQL